MATCKPFSTITYNTKEFLIETLNSLIYKGYLSYWEFIEHLPDSDDKKKHIHLYMIPIKSINLATFKSFFLEYEPNNVLPLCPTIFMPSKYFGDWYWYALHDKDYLRSKGQTRNIHYKDEDIISSDRTMHFQFILNNPLYNFCKMSDMFLHQFVLDSVYSGVSLKEILKNKFIPLNKVNFIIQLYNAIAVTINDNDLRTDYKLEAKRLLSAKEQKYKQTIVNLKCLGETPDDLFD